MLLRICLIVAILGAGAVVAVNFVMVKPAMEATITARDSEKQQKETAQKDLTTAKKDLTAARTTLTNTTKTLATTKTALDAANTTVKTLEKDKTDLAATLKEAQNQRDQRQAELVKWEQLHLTPEQVTLLETNLDKATEAWKGADAESKLLAKKLHDTQADLDRIRGTDTNTDIPLLPAGLRGQVVAVDPEYSFVILNIGQNQGVLPKGVMMIARDGRLIGKVQISSVTNTQSVANILPAWRRGDVMEGDEVID